jgi:hypothetical protein
MLKVSQPLLAGGGADAATAAVELATSDNETTADATRRADRRMNPVSSEVELSYSIPERRPSTLYRRCSTAGR